MSVVSVVVTYNPDSEFPAKLKNIADQSDSTIIVDNRSGENIEDYLTGIDEVVLIQNSANMGIATALNQGIAYALAYGAEYVCLFDQDSEISPGFIRNLLKGFEIAADIGIVAANYISPVSGRLGYERKTPVVDGYGKIDHAITSGSMIKMSILPEIGLMRDQLFIDYVDVEFSERLKGNYIILVTTQPIMVHPIGQAENHRFFNRTVAASNHSPLRRYYMARNCASMIRDHAFSNRSFARISAIRLAKIFAMILLFENNKIIKLRALVLGLFDGLSNHMGQCEYVF